MATTGLDQLWTLRPTIVTPGCVAFNTEAMAHVGSPLRGRAVEIKARLGQDVKKGDELCIIESPELGEAQAELLQKRVARESTGPAADLAKASWDRARNLYEQTRGTSLTEVQRREAEYKAAVAAQRAVDAAAMADAASVLMGRHDFDSFRSVNCQSKTSIKTIDLLDVTRAGEKGGEEEIAIDIASRSFLHNQVRIIAGTLAMVGRGQWSRKDVEEALAARDRSRAGPTAPPTGLCLMEVSYGSAGAGDTEEAADDQ